jgi:hypothetical protein
MRQRRHVMGHFRLLGTHWDVATPFYDDRCLATFLSMPRPILEARAIQRHVLRLHFPRFAAVPHPEEAMPILLGPADHFGAALRGVLDRVPSLWRLNPAKARWLPHQTRLRFAAMRDIWQVSMYQLLRDRRLLTERMEQAFPALRRFFRVGGERFDPALFRDLAPRELSRILVLTEYAAALDRRLAGRA